MKTYATDKAEKKNIRGESRTGTIRIVLVDDNELFRAGIKSLISAEKDFSVVGEVKDRDQAKDLIRNKKPHVILVNIELKHSDGLHLIPELMAACKTSRLAVLTDSKDPEIHREAVELGATGIISKQDPSKLMMEALKRVHEGGAWLDRFVSAEMFVNLPGEGKRTLNGHKISSLTRREREVIRMLGKGLKDKQIAERLFISDVTVHHHLTSIFSKLDVANRIELIIFAYRNKLAEF